MPNTFLNIEKLILRVCSKKFGILNIRFDYKACHDFRLCGHTNWRVPLRCIQIKQSNWVNSKYCRWKLHNLTQTNMHQKYNLVWLQCTSWFQIMWARQLEGANTSYQILTIGEATHINDNRFLIPKSTVNNVRRYSHR